ncbi:hypothetical protein [Cronobacter sakazakii]|uniref:hypothetical protein n=1 Tax=Cronobacter sakazakii TaxID=28141 RepID=UPI0013A66688|nr:hypothetical protein [Cronobacter sakazakii]ELY2893545.1 hypothetical protein [Cronobacter sakazakii]ELY6206488.1 hypothetical protein [Cronobacter sakazakii]KAB1063294.1 hypothetical protein AUN10_06595 [Cronobacter sakazakii]MCI0305079.1 hypothetical protein [Cronobacter sakazakii]MDT3531854.1 hypothetical protein [Cronobacter sakazakii]
MKVVDLELPEKGLVLIDCENEEVLTTINAEKNLSGKARLPQRVLLMREGKSKWRHMVLRKNEFVCSLKSLKDVISVVAKDDDSNFFLK